MRFDWVAATYRRPARWLSAAGERVRGVARRRRRASNTRTEPPPVHDPSSAPSTAPARPTVPLVEHAATERAAGRVGYRFLPGEPVDDGMRRIVGQELASALDDLDVVVVDDPSKAVHDCRRKCKKMRAAVRLVRPAMADGQYARINGLARDASRALAPLRDAVAMSETFARLVELTPARDAPAEAMAAVDAALSERRRGGRRPHAELDAEHPAIGRARDLLADLDRAPFWLERAGRADPDGWDAIGPGVAKTYRRGRRAMAAAVEHGSGERFHDWRKRAKYTRYHLGLLTPTAPVLLDPLEDAFHALTDALGDAHDLEVIDEWLDGKEAARLTGDLAGVRAAVVRMRLELEARAVELGGRLYAEPSRRFSERLGRYWTTWQADRADRPVGKLDVVA